MIPRTGITELETAILIEKLTNVLNCPHISDDIRNTISDVIFKYAQSL